MPALAPLLLLHCPNAIYTPGVPDVPAPAHPLTVCVDGAKRTICCHRATLSGRFAPNSLEAVAECVEAGVPRLEIDVRFLADDSMLIFHDYLLERGTTSSGRVDELTGESARGLHYAFAGEPALCFLQDVVAAMESGSTLLQVDLKLMRPISGARAAQLARTLAPLEGRVLVGSQAHWNLRPLAQLGLPVAFDPTLQWHGPGLHPRPAEPSHQGVHGLWDDSPLAWLRHASGREYAEARIADISGLLPQAAEWMVDIDTIDHIAALGVSLGKALAERGIALAGWTLRDRGHEETSARLRALFNAGAVTVIAEDAPVVAGYAAALGL